MKEREHYREIDDKFRKDRAKAKQTRRIPAKDIRSLEARIRAEHRKGLK